MNIHLFFLLLPFLVVYTSCKPKEYTAVSGQTMGTYYSIKANVDLPAIQMAIENLLEELNLQLSTYIDSSFISLFNNAENGLNYRYGNQVPEYFDDNFKMARYVHEKSGGAFDPTVMPLVNYWGFGYNDPNRDQNLDSASIDSIMHFVGFEKVTIKKVTDTSSFLMKERKEMGLDFSALAKGYAIDKLAELITDHGATAFLIEIGGDLRTKGKNQRSEKWTLGINKPKEDAALNEIIKYIAISGKAVATSGNYRNYYKKNDVIYSHTINPRTGYPERSNLLSATVITDECMVADAYATAFMVMGLQPSIQLANELDEIEALFIYTDEQGVFREIYTQGFEQYILN